MANFKRNYFKLYVVVDVAVVVVVATVDVAVALVNEMYWTMGLHNRCAYVKCLS